MLRTPEFQRANFSLLRDLLGRVTWAKTLEGREAKKRWVIFKGHLHAGGLQPGEEKSPGGPQSSLPVPKGQQETWRGTFCK